MGLIANARLILTPLAFAMACVDAASAQTPPPERPEGAPAMATASTASITPISQLRDVPEVRIAGRVVERYGNKLIVEDASGRMLVELGREGARLAPAAIGDRWVVDGRFDDGLIHATAVTLASGEVVTLKRPGPPGARHEGKGPRHGPKGPPGAGYDPARVLAAVSGAGYVAASIIDVKPRHAEVAARTADGQPVTLHVEFDGTIRKEEATPPPMAESAVRAILDQGGYTLVGPMVPFKRHMIVTARNSRGETVEVDVHRDGTIKRERVVTQ